MPLTPEAILKDYINRDIEKPIAVELLITLIDNADNIKTRIESINTLNKIPIEDDKTFKFLEHLMISDSNEEVRYLTCRVIKRQFLNKPVAVIRMRLQSLQMVRVKAGMIPKVPLYPLTL